MHDAPDFHASAVAEAPVFGSIVPAIVADTHRDAGERFLEYVAATIRNGNTRAAYMNAVGNFLRFAPVAGLGSLAEVRSIHLSAYIEDIGDRFAPQTVKQRLAALRGLFDGSRPTRRRRCGARRTLPSAARPRSSLPPKPSG